MPLYGWRPDRDRATKKRAIQGRLRCQPFKRALQTRTQPADPQTQIPKGKSIATGNGRGDHQYGPLEAISTIMLLFGGCGSFILVFSQFLFGGFRMTAENGGTFVAAMGVCFELLLLSRRRG